MPDLATVGGILVLGSDYHNPSAFSGWTTMHLSSAQGIQASLPGFEELW